LRSLERCNLRKKVWGWRGSNFRSKELVDRDLQDGTSKACHICVL
jgi:hypothetical protein